MGFKIRKLTNSAPITTATAAAVAGMKVDISHIDRFSLHYANSAAAALTNLTVQASPTGETASSPSTWIQVPTASLPQPSALGANSSVLTPPMDNAYKWLRITAATASTAVLSGTISVTIQGFSRY